MSDFLRHVPFDVPEPVRPQGDTGSWLRVEEFSDGATMVIRAELPGVDPERDIDISVSERTLTIDILASYTGGILEVSVPLSEQQSTPRRKVPVHRTDTTGTAARGTAPAGAETVDAISEDSSPSGADFVPRDHQPPGQPQEESTS